MKESDFDNLDIQEKGIVVFDKGEFIAVREYYNHRVCLYSLPGFFVEVHYSPDSNQITRIEKVNDEKTLSLYLSDIDLKKYLD